MRIRSGVLGAVLVCLALPAGAQVNFDTVQVRPQLVAPGVYLLQGSGGNIGLAVGDDAVFVVDDQYAPLTPKILAAIAAVTPKPVRFVVNTHWHFDHTGGNENMGKAGALLMAHENVRLRLTTGGLIEAVNRTEPPASPGALPVVTFTDAVTFHINGDSLRVWHVPPAHTDGDAIVHFTKSNVVHTGDLFVSGGLPFVDLSSGGSIHSGFSSGSSRFSFTGSVSTRPRTVARSMRATRENSIDRVGSTLMCAMRIFAVYSSPSKRKSLTSSLPAIVPSMRAYLTCGT